MLQSRRVIPDAAIAPRHPGRCNRSKGPGSNFYTLPSMDTEKIKVKTETGQTLDVVVLNKRAEHITVVLGEGVHSVKCDLSPTRNGMAYVGKVMGREIVYERSKEQVQADIDRVNPALRQSSRKR
jgi:hypothetical protein